MLNNKKNLTRIKKNKIIYFKYFILKQSFKIKIKQ